MNISEDGYKEIFNHSAIAKIILSANSIDYTILDVNLAYLQTTNTNKELLIGKPLFTVFPINPSDPHAKHIEQTIASFEQVIKTKKPDVMEKYRYDIPIPGTTDFLERYWVTTNMPILDETGEVKFIIHSPRDITDLFHLKNREKAGLDALKNQRKQLYATFMQTPVGIGIFKGPNYTVSMINPVLCKIYGKKLKDLIGQPLFEVLPFAKGQGFEEMLDLVRRTGETYEGLGVEVNLIRDGILEKVYVDFVYQPFYEDDSTSEITGIIAVGTEVTAKVKAMHQLEEAEERARLAADAVDLGVFDLNILSGEIITSERFAHIFGFKRPVQRNKYVEVMHPEDLMIRKKALEDAIENGIMHYEIRVFWPDQSIHWVRIEGKVIYDKEGNPMRMIGTVLDITMQKWNKEQQRKLITLVDNSVDLMSTFNMDGVVTYMNTAGVKLLGLKSLENALSVPLIDLHDPENYEFFKQEVLPAVIRDGNWAGNMKVRNYTSGEIFPVFVNCICIDDSVSGRTIGIGAVMRDLRPELSAKKALAESELLLRNITSAAPIALWKSNQKGEITYVNQTWVDWSGNTFEENLQYGWMSIIFPEDIKHVVETFQNSLHLKLSYEVEFRIRHADGTQHWCTLMGEPQFNEKDGFTGYIGSCTDITEYKELQNQKDSFIGIASHELKTPVTSLKGYAQVMQRILKKKGHEMEAEMMMKMDVQLNRLTRLIADLLDVTKINAGKIQFNDRVFDLQSMLTEVIKDLQHTTDKNVLVENYQPTDKTFADKERIEQVVINLVTNAIKYSPPGAKIIIHLQQVNRELLVGVEDFGIGVSEENKTRIFEQFYRVSGEMQHTFPGLGLGLYISSEIIKRAGGRIWVESKENEGSCFYFSLPVHTA